MKKQKSNRPTWMAVKSNQPKSEKKTWNLKFKKRKRKSENKLHAIAIKKLIKCVKIQRELG